MTEKISYFSYVPPDYWDTAILLGWLPAASLAGHSLGQNDRILMIRLCDCQPVPMPWSKQKRVPAQIPRGTVVTS